jgi:hypothetical protein
MAVTLAPEEAAELGHHALSSPPDTHRFQLALPDLACCHLISNNLQPGSRAEPPAGAHYPGLSEIEVCHGHESDSVSTRNVGV